MEERAKELKELELRRSLGVVRGGRFGKRMLPS